MYANQIAVFFFCCCLFLTVPSESAQFDSHAKSEVL